MKAFSRKAACAAGGLSINQWLEMKPAHRNLAVIFMGPPGAGKGIQARQIARRLSILQISTGDILREAIRKRTPLGLEAQSRMNRGELVPDQVVCGLVEERIQEPDYRRGFILDGFPRTLAQAQRIDPILKGLSGTRVHVLNLEVDEEKLLKRQIGRRICSVCGDIYNIYFSPPHREGICDQDGGKLIQRADDTDKAARQRQITYREQTEPLVDHYRAKKLLHNIDGDQEPDSVTENVLFLFNTL